MGRLEGKVALITGAAGGIGRATTEAFVAEGGRVWMVDRSAQTLDDAVEQFGDAVAGRAADVGDEADVARSFEDAVERFGGVDIVVANAGVEGTLAPLELQRAEDFDQVLRVNVRGVWLAFKHGAAALRARGGGSMIATSSVAGVVGSAGLGPYVASKHAVMGLVKTAALELAGDAIRVNSVNPGPVDNRMMRRSAFGEGWLHVDGAPRSLRHERRHRQRHALPREYGQCICDGARPVGGWWLRGRLIWRE